MAEIATSRLSHRPRPRALRRIAVGGTLCLSIVGCGGGDDNNSNVQAQINHESRQAAQAARQSEQIKQLQKELKSANSKPSVVVQGTPSETAAKGDVARDAAESSAVGDWPGGSGYTAILASVRTEGEARGIQQKSTAAGLDAGVLYSSEFSSLRPGYWVVFSGTFGSETEAARRASHAKQLGVGDAYPRFVSPSG